MVLGIILGFWGQYALNTGNNIQSLGLKKLAKRDQARKKEFDLKTIKEEGEGEEDQGRLGGGGCKRPERGKRYANNKRFFLQRSYLPLTPR